MDSLLSPTSLDPIWRFTVDRYHAMIEAGIPLTDSEPEPDLMVARGDSADYPDSHPKAADVALVVEISDTTLARDRGAKMRMYARAGIPAYWIVDLNESRVEVRTDPGEDGYRMVTFCSRTTEFPLRSRAREWGWCPFPEFFRAATIRPRVGAIGITTRPGLASRRD